MRFAFTDYAIPIQTKRPSPAVEKAAPIESRHHKRPKSGL
jgi:hypothetical protein